MPTRISNDGSFLENISKPQNKDRDISQTAVDFQMERGVKEGPQSVNAKDKMSIPNPPYLQDARTRDSYKDEVSIIDCASYVQRLIANQWAAKEIHLRLKGETSTMGTE